MSQVLEIGDAYLLLERDERRPQSGLLTRPSGVSTEAGDVLLAVDGAGARRLLVPVQDEDVPTDRRSRGVALLPDRLGEDGAVQLFAALVCTDPALSRVFERLVEDTLSKLDAGEIPPLRAVQQVLGEWRSFLSAAGGEVSRETALGLVGELEMLRRMDRIPDPLSSWVGPTGAVHDFVRGDVEIEVKATASVEANTVRISGLDQLDPPPEGRLFLAVVHLRADENAPSLQERVESLLEAGTPRDRLYDLLARLGYVHGRDPDAHRYRVNTIRVWPVTDRFPGVRRSDVSEPRLKGVSHVRYELALDSAPPPLAEGDADALLRSLTYAAS